MLSFPSFHSVTDRVELTIRDLMSLDALVETDKTILSGSVTDVGTAKTGELTTQEAPLISHPIILKVPDP